MIFRSFFIMAMVLLTSCGSHVVFRTSKCNAKIKWGTTAEKQDFSFEDSINTPLGFWYPTQVDITKFLKRNNIECSKIKTLSVVIKSNFKDVVKTAIPFLSTKSFIISGTYLK